MTAIERLVGAPGAPGAPNNRRLSRESARQGTLDAEGLDRQLREGRAQLRQVVLDGHQRGLSQRRIAELTNRSQPEVSRLLREISAPARTWLTARFAAEAIKDELQRGDEDFALRTLVGAVNDFRGLSQPGEIQEFLRRPSHRRPALGRSHLTSKAYRSPSPHQPTCWR